MLKKILALFDEPESTGPKDRHGDLALASAVLLVEVARADYARDGLEDGRLRGFLQQCFDLDEDSVAELIAFAEAEVDATVSLHHHVGVMNERYSPGDKYEFVKGLWQVAFADGELHHYEEHLIRRLADLLHVPHRDFIRAKHAKE
jgi:uncharacterized tellurite resistance protein B-like protein